MSRNSTLDILKGIGIILVVIGHCCSPRILNIIIYSFHMPLFFIASGYFFKEKCLYNKREYALRKVRGLYIPYLKWCIIFLLLHNLFFYIGILNDSYGNSSGMCSGLYSMKDMVKHLFNITFRMTDYEVFILGAYWFMRSLFVGCLLFCLCSWFINRFFLKNVQSSIAFITILFCLAGGILTFFNTRIPYVPQGGYREVMAVFFLGCGYFLSKKEDYLKKGIISVIATLIFFICVAIHPTSMNYKSSFVDWTILPFTGVSGFAITYYFSSKMAVMKNLLSNVLIYIGGRTFYILTFHFLMFKPASLLKAYIYGLDWRVIGSHPVVLIAKDNWFWIIYSITSLALSLMLTKLIKK